MSYKKIGDPIDVVIAFHRKRPEPMIFKWQNRYYQIRRVDLIHAERVGRKKIYYFSVSDNSAAYRLSFRTDSLI